MNRACNPVWLCQKINEDACEEEIRQTHIERTIARSLTGPTLEVIFTP